MNPVLDSSDIAATGVDRISLGARTKNGKAFDVSMRFSAAPV